MKLKLFVIVILISALVAVIISNYLLISKYETINKSEIKKIQKSLDKNCLGADSIRVECSNKFQKTPKNISRLFNSIGMNQNFPHYNLKTHKKNVLIWGDSKIEQWIPSLRFVFNKLGYNLILRTFKRCPPWVIESSNIPWNYKDCAALNKSVLSSDLKKADIIIFGTRWIDSGLIVDQDVTYDWGSVNQKATKDWVNKVLSYNIPIVYLESSPYYTHTSKSFFYNNNAHFKIRRNEVYKETKTNLNILQTFAKNKIYILNVEELFCDYTFCYQNIGGLPVSFDGIHMSYIFSYTTRNFIYSKINKVIEEYNK